MKKRYLYILIILLISIILLTSLFFENFLDAKDITIFEKRKEWNQGYNLGDILNMTYYMLNWSNQPHPHYESMYKTACNDWKDENNILSYYCKSRTDETEPIPNDARINESIDAYISNNLDNKDLQDLITKVSNDSVLLIHVRSGDYGDVEEEYINSIKKISKNYSKIIFICGIHDNGPESFSDYNKKVLINSLEKITNSIDNIEHEINFNKADYHVVMMRKCKNLLVHRGGFSIIGTIAFTGKNLYITEKFTAIHHEELMNKLKLKNVQII